MDIADYTRGPAEKLLEFAGEDVTLVNYEQTGQDPYGDPEYDEVETTARAEIVVRGTPNFERRIEGVDSSVTAVAWIMDEYEDDITTGSDSDEETATTLETGTHSYQVHNWFDENNGKLRLHLDDS